MKKTILFLLLLPLLWSGCAFFETKEDMTVDELVSSGMYHYEDGDYKKSIESFEKLKDWYPFSKYASLAELKIADAHFHLEEYSEAISAYETFESLHPQNEAIPYVIYQIGACYFKQMDTIDRDQSNVRKALATFQRLIRQYPDDDYASEARERVKECYKSLAGNEFLVGLFYYKTKRYKSALNRFKAVLENYPDVGVHQQTLRYITLCREELKQIELKDKGAINKDEVEKNKDEAGEPLEKKEE